VIIVVLYMLVPQLSHLVAKITIGGVMIGAAASGITAGVFFAVREAIARRTARKCGAILADILTGGSSVDPTPILEAAYRRFPGRADILLQYTTWLDWTGRNREALEVFARHFKVVATDPHLLLEFAWAIIDTGGDMVRAVSLLEDAMKIRRGSEFVYGVDVCVADSYAWVAYLRKDYTGALAALKPALPMASTTPDIAYHAAEIYFRLDRIVDALHYAEMACRNKRPFGRRREAEQLLRRLSGGGR
jgi:tetratricopeptide (TPR) repeat protein